MIQGRYLGVPVGATPGNLIKEMAAKIDTERGRDIYRQTIAIAEPVFADIKYGKGLDRFTLRGKIKVNIQWVLYCMVHNIGKILTYGFAEDTRERRGPKLCRREMTNHQG